MAYADYLDPPSGSNYMTKVGAGGYTDDSAMFAGTTPYSSPDQTTAINNFVAMVTNGVVAGDQSIARYTGLLNTYATAMITAGKKVIQYEGKQDWNVLAGTSQGSHTLTAADQNFMLGIQGSAQWAAAMTSYLAVYKATTGAAMPAEFNIVGPRWGYTTVNSTTSNPDTYSGGVEGAALNATWTAFGTYNAGLP
jgi:hypothetical protein